MPNTHHARGRTIPSVATGFIIYLRRSTDDDRNQQNSLEYQLTHCKRYAASQGLQVAALTIEGLCEDGVIAERHTAYKTSDLRMRDDGQVSFDILRPKFLQLVQLLERGVVKGVIAYSLDRLSRNDLDKSIIKQLMRAGRVEIRTVLADYDKSSAGDLHFDIDGMFAAHWSRVTAERVRTAANKLLAEGKWPRRAPIGYLDQGSDNKPLDPHRAPLVRQILELATEGWSLSQLHRWAVGQGLTNKARRPIASAGTVVKVPPRARSGLVTEKGIEQMVHNPFYAGLVESDGELIQGRHEALISFEQFQNIQASLRGRTTSVAYLDREFFTYRGLVRCACGRMFSPYRKRSLVYYLGGCRRSCTIRRPNLKESAVDELVVSALAKITIDEERAEQIMELARQSTRASESARAVKAAARKRVQLERDFEYLTKNKLSLLRDQVYSPLEYAAEVSRVSGELDTLAEQERKPVDTGEQAAKLLSLPELARLAQQCYELALPAEKREIFLWVFPELGIERAKGQFSANVRAREGFQAFLDSTLSDVGSPNIVRSELARLAPAVDDCIRRTPSWLKATGMTPHGHCVSLS